MKTIVTVTVKHDNGKKNLNVWADSIEQARDFVCKNENCPPSAIVSAKVKRLTIHDIKCRLEDSGSHYFSRSNMRLFGQTMRDFSVTRHGDDKFYFCAHHKHGKSERIYNPFTNKLEFCS